MKNSFAQRAFTMAASVSDGLPVLQVQDYRAIGKDKFALLFSSLKTNTEYTQDDYNAALSAQTDAKLGIVRDSLFYSSSKFDGKPVLRCIASANFESMEATQENMKARNLKVTVANILEDDNGGIWKIVSNGDIKQIVQVTREDYSGLLAKRRARSTMTASVDNEFDIDYQDGDFVYFVNPEIEAMDHGFVIKGTGQDYVVSRTTNKANKIEAHQVIEAVSTSGYGLNLAQKRKELTASAMTDYIDYLKALYGKNSEYVKAWIAAIKSSPERVA